MALGKPKEALEALQEVMELLQRQKQSDMLLSIDIEIMQLLLGTQESINIVNSGSVTPADIKQNNSKLQQAKKRLTELIELYESGKLETIKR